MTAFETRLSFLRSVFANKVCITVPQAANAMGVDEDTLRADPTLPVVFVGSRRKILLDSLARWMTEKEKVRIP